MSDTNTGIDTNALYGRYQEKEDWRNNLHKKTVHKALNIPMDDDVQVTNTTTNSAGFGWKELAVLAALGLGGAAIWKTNGPQLVQQTLPAPTQGVQQQLPDMEQKFDVLFYQKNADGTVTPINVPRVPQK